MMILLRLLAGLWLTSWVAAVDAPPPRKVVPRAEADESRPDRAWPVQNEKPAERAHGELNHNQPPFIMLRETEPATVMFTEYEGPYWGVGPVLTRVRADMAKAGRTGATFVYYAGDPRARILKPGSTRVGFFAKSGAGPDGVYVADHWKPQQVVTTTVLGPNAGTMALYPALRAWAAKEGYEAIGPIIEVYYPTSEGGSVENQQTEIRMPVRVAAEPAGGHRINASNQPGALDAKPDDAVQVGVPEVRIEPEVTIDSHINDGAESSRIDSNTDKAEVELEIPDEAEEAKIAETDLAQLLEMGEYERAMGVVMAEASTWTSSDLIWLEQVADRLGAISDGLIITEQGGHKIGRLSQSFRTALEATPKQAPFPTDAQPAAQLSVGNGLEPERAEIIRRLDRLMARIAMRAVDEKRCLVEVEEVIAEVDRSLHHLGHHARKK